MSLGKLNLRVEGYKPRRTLKKASKKRVKPIKYPKVLEALQKRVVLKIYGNDCFTCPAKNLQGSNCHLGHVPWGRTELSTQCKFDYRYTRSQCFSCNVWKHGRGAEALWRMQKEGIDVQALIELNEATKGKVCNKKWYEEKITEYEALITLER